MALQEHDREDLLRDGRTMVFRGECEIDGATVLIGFRKDGQLSLYVDADPVFQFNKDGQLRRAFFRGCRLAAERGVLMELSRDSRGGNVQMIKTPIDAGVLAEVQSQAAKWIERIGQCVGDPAFQWRVAGEDPKAYRARVAAWIDKHGAVLPIAESPNV